MRRVVVHSKQASMLWLVEGRLRPFFFFFSFLLSIAETGANDQIRAFIAKASQSILCPLLQFFQFG